MASVAPSGTLSPPESRGDYPTGRPTANVGRVPPVRKPTTLMLSGVLAATPATACQSAEPTRSVPGYRFSPPKELASRGQPTGSVHASFTTEPLPSRHGPGERCALVAAWGRDPGHHALGRGRTGVCGGRGLRGARRPRLHPGRGRRPAGRRLPRERRRRHSLLDTLPGTGRPAHRGLPREPALRVARLHRPGDAEAGVPVASGHVPGDVHQHLRRAQSRGPRRRAGSAPGAAAPDLPRRAGTVLERGHRPPLGLHGRQPADSRRLLRTRRPPALVWVADLRNRALRRHERHSRPAGGDPALAHRHPLGARGRGDHRQRRRSGQATWAVPGIGPAAAPRGRRRTHPSGHT